MIDSTQVVAIAQQASIQAIQDYQNSFTKKDYIEIGFGIISLIILAFAAYYAKQAPINAVKVGNELGDAQMKRDAKMHLFRTLFAHRGNFIHHNTVAALNQIDLIFYDNPKVIAEWREFYKQLSPTEPSTIAPDKGENYWREVGIRRENQFREILVQMALELGYDLQSLQQKHLAEPAYTPTAHGNEHDQQEALRVAATQFFEKGHSQYDLSKEYFELSIDFVKYQRAMAEAQAKEAEKEKESSKKD